MNFKKTAYAASKGKVIALIKASYDWENTEGFIADGVVRPDVFEQQPLRILCILAESYGYGGGDMPDIEDQDVDQMITRDEWRLMRGLLSSKLETASILQTALTKVAWLNIKKASNRTASTRLDPVLVAQHARQNRIILSEQIDSIAADLTIVLGKVTFGVLHEINLLGPETKRGLKGKIQATGLGSHVLELSHPGYHAHWSYDAIYNNYETICSQMDWFGKC